MADSNCCARCILMALIGGEASLNFVMFSDSFKIFVLLLRSGLNELIFRTKARVGFVVQVTRIEFVDASWHEIGIWVGEHEDLTLNLPVVAFSENSFNADWDLVHFNSVVFFLLFFFLGRDGGFLFL